MTSRPNKKPKLTEDNNTLTRLSLEFDSISNSTLNFSSQLNNTLNEFNQQELILQLDSIYSNLLTFNQNLNRLEEESTELNKWRDKFDQDGTFFWNKSIIIKYDNNDNNITNQTLFAKLRLVAFHLVSLGAVKPLTLESHIHLLQLCTKTAQAFIPLSNLPIITSLLELSAQHAEFIPPTSTSTITSTTSNNNKVLLSYYTTRILFASNQDNLGMAKYLMEKAKGLNLNEIESERLAELAKDVGERLIVVNPSKSNSKSKREGKEEEEGVDEEEKGKRAGLAVEWLLDAVRMVENKESKVSKLLQISALKILAQAYLNLFPAKSGWMKAESVVSEILKLDPSAKLHRRLVKLIIVREGSDSEILETFLNAASRTPESEDDILRLLAEIHGLPSSRRSLRFTILTSLLDTVLRRLATSSSSSLKKPEVENLDIEFLIQILYVIVFSITLKDAEKLEEVYNKVSKALPNFSLPTSPAFVLTTYTWRLGDKAHTNSQFLLASSFYLLTTHKILSNLSNKTWSKAFRKTSLCLSELGLFDRAEEVMRRENDGKGGTDGRSLFVRFYNFVKMKDDDRATEILNHLILAPDFNLNMLLWASKTAHESGSKPLLRHVLTKLLDVCREKSTVGINVDTMVLVRCLIRLYVAALDTEDGNNSENGIALEKHFETALELAETLSTRMTEMEPILQNITWLYQTGYNLCARFTGIWDSSILVNLYTIVASLLELESTLSKNPLNQDSTFKLWSCRFAAISTKFFNVRLLDSSSERVEGYKLLLPEMTSMRISWSDTRTRFPNIEKGEIMERAILGMEIESLSALNDWFVIANLVEEISKPERQLPISILKEIAERVVSSDHCPGEVVYSVLKRTLDGLSVRKDLAPGALASWLRIIITFLLQRGDIDQAYLYAQNAFSFAKSQSSIYSSPEELQWLVATTWDQGLDCYSSNAIKKGKEWCYLGLELAKSTDQLMYAKLEPYFKGLQLTYPEEMEE